MLRHHYEKYCVLNYMFCVYWIEPSKIHLIWMAFAERGRKWFRWHNCFSHIRGDNPISKDLSGSPHTHTHMNCCLSISMNATETLCSPPHTPYIYFNMHGKEFQTYILLCKCSMNKLTNRCTTLYNYTKHVGEKLKPSRDTMWVSVLCSTLVLLSTRTAFPDLIWDTCM